MIWGNGVRLLPGDHLEEALVRSASRFANAAVRAITSDELGDLLYGAIGLGGAVELIAKAAVANTSPVLLAAQDRGKKTAYAGRVLGLLGRVPEPPHLAIESIDVETAVGLTGALHRQVQTRWADVKDSIAVRNSAAHMGLVLRDDMNARRVGAMVRFVDEVLEALDRDRTSFWDRDLVNFLQHLREESTPPVELRVRMKVERAKSALQWLYVVDEHERQQLARAKSASTPRSNADLEMSTECPACGYEGRVFYYVDVDVERDGTVLSAGFMPTAFACPVCGLWFDEDELNVAGMHVPDPAADWHEDFGDNR